MEIEISWVAIALIVCGQSYFFESFSEKELCLFSHSVIKSDYLKESRYVFVVYYKSKNGEELQEVSNLNIWNVSFRRIVPCPCTPTFDIVELHDFVVNFRVHFLSIMDDKVSIISTTDISLVNFQMICLVEIWSFTNIIIVIRIIINRTYYMNSIVWSRAKSNERYSRSIKCTAMLAIATMKQRCPYILLLKDSIV